MKIRLGRSYRPSAPHNQKAWTAVESKLREPGPHSYDELRAVAFNTSPKVGHRFIDYAVNSGWLVAED
jgi:hypothetical protein